MAKLAFSQRSWRDARQGVRRGSHSTVWNHVTKTKIPASLVECPYEDRLWCTALRATVTRTARIECVKWQLAGWKAHRVKCSRAFKQVHPSRNPVA